MRRGKQSRRFLFGLFKTVATLFAVAIPVFGVWVASSLAAYLDGPRWLTILVGVMMFPVIPMFWELRVELLYRRRGKYEVRYLTGFERILLRTIALNFVFVVGVLAWKPASAFTALSARGDWMLDGREGPAVEAARRGLFFTSEKLEWLYEYTHDNPFEIDDTSEEPLPIEPEKLSALELETEKLRDAAPEPAPDPSVPEEPRAEIADAGTTTILDASIDAAPHSHGEPDAGQRVAQPSDSTEAVQPESTAPQPKWPLSTELHSVVSAMPESAKKSPKTVAAYISVRVSDSYERVKAIHDYVVDRIYYDFAGLRDGRYPPHDPHTVNKRKIAVCAGYARLFQAIARHAGYNAEYIVGAVRDENSEIDGDSHAWNAIEIEGKWYLVDPTWDSGHAVHENRSERHDTDYLLTPPAVFGLDHFPSQKRWQLSPAPLTRGEFIRQPMMSPRFYWQGFELVTPVRSHVSVHGFVEIKLKTPPKMFVSAKFVEKGQDNRNECKIERVGQETSVRCNFAKSGSHQVLLFSNTQRYGMYQFAGKFEVVNLGGDEA